MNRFLFLGISTLILVGVFGCKRQVVDSTSETFVVKPALAGQIKSGTVTTNSRTAIDENLGVFVTQYAKTDPRDLLSSGNVYDNVVVSDAGVPTTKMYYPSRRDAIDVFAYLPYNATIDPTAVNISTSTTQTAVTIKAEDFLRGVKKQDAASSTPNAVDVQLSHVMSLVQINLSVPSEFANKQIESVTASQLMGVHTVAKYNIGTDTWSGLATPADVEMCQIGTAIENQDGGLEYKYEAVVAPQTAPVKFYKITVKYKDNSIQNFECTLEAAPEYKTKVLTTYNVSLSSYGKLSVTSESFDDWNDERVAGKLATPVSNTLRFVLYEQEYWENLKTVKLSIGGQVYTSTLKFDNQSNRIVAYYEATLPDDAGKTPDDYPYTISSIKFIKADGTEYDTFAGDLSISSSGLMNIAVIKNVALLATSDEIKEWTNDIKIANIPMKSELEFILLDQHYWQGLTSVDIQIDNVWYKCSGLKFVATPNGNKIVSKYVASLPDDLAKMPGTYPYLIQKVKFNKSTELMMEISCLIPVTKDGRMQIGVINDKLIKVASDSDIANWINSLVTSSVPLYSELEFVLLNQPYWQGLTSADIQIDKVWYKCSGVKFEATPNGNKVISKYVAKLPDDNFKMPAGPFPYSIQRVKFTKGASVMMDAKCEVLITRDGRVQIGIVNNDIIKVTSESQIKTWLDELLYGGIPKNVDITFKLLNQDNWQGVTTVELTIDGVVYTSNVTFVANGTQVVSSYTAKLPDNNNKIPARYPMIISEIVFKKAGVAQITSTDKYYITKDGNVELAIIKNN